MTDFTMPELARRLDTLERSTVAADRMTAEIDARRTADANEKEARMLADAAIEEDIKALRNSMTWAFRAVVGAALTFIAQALLLVYSISHRAGG